MGVRRLLRRPPAEDVGPGPSRRPPRPPTAGQLRRERRALLRVREERIRDLGGIILDMYRRDRFNHKLVSERCSELIALEERLGDVDRLLAQAFAGRAPAGHCLCGAPVFENSHFCANCGRPVGAAPVVSCGRCGEPLPAEAAFCARCGAATGEQARVPEAAEAGEAGAVSEPADAGRA
jgi:Double zinc ribbon